MYKKINTTLSKEYIRCENAKPCLNRATQRHHLLPNTIKNRKLYHKLIDHDLNIKLLCAYCHINARHMTETEFCEKLGIEPRSKTFKNKKLRG